MSDDARQKAPGAPILPNVLLALAFLFFVVVGIVTVLVPELSTAPEDEEGAAPTAPQSPAPSED